MEPSDSREPVTADTEVFGDEQARPIERRLAPGTMVGRYLVIEQIGAGGMGLVYSAFDPELDRKIAIKLLRLRYWNQAGQERVRREAKTMAKLSHPNVVAVYDVGVFEEQLFVAMELVDGEPLTTWLGNAPRTWRQVVRVMIGAGRGIAAAHAAGVVHRDVKPDNILVTPSGQARVVDFGVADDAAECERKDLIAGTLPYMAPEQRKGAASGQSDQFGFCVTLSEALYGFRPAANAATGSSSSLSNSSRWSQKPAKPAAVGRPPVWLRRALRRGLQQDPARRYPSMDALLAQLNRGTSRRIAMATAAAIAFAGVAVSSAVLLAATDDPAVRCQAAGQAIDSVWSPEVRTSVDVSFAASGASYATDTAERVAALIDARASNWKATRRDVCEATWARGEQSQALLDLRMGCLDRRLNEIRSLVAVFSDKVERDLVDRAVQATLSLDSISACLEVASHGADSVYPPPQDKAERVRLAKLQARIDELEVQYLAGRFEKGVAEGQALIDDVDELAYPPSQAEALLVFGNLLAEAGEHERAEKELSRGIRLATLARDHRTAVRMYAARISLAGVKADHHDVALAMEAGADAAILMAGDAPLLRAEILRAIGTVHQRKGDLASARDYLQRAIAIHENDGISKPTWYAATLNAYGIVMEAERDFDQAIASYERARETWENTVGPFHPWVGAAINNLGGTYWHSSRFDEALGQYQRALALWERALPPDHPNVASALTNLGAVLDKQGKFNEAESLFRRALAIYEAKLDANHQNIGIALFNLGEVLHAQDKHADALFYHRRALQVFESSLGSDHEFVGEALIGLGRALNGAGDYADAIVQLERAVAIHRSHNAPNLPDSQLALAHALWSARRDRPRARRLAEAARATWTERGDAKEKLQNVDQWLANH